MSTTHAVHHLCLSLGRVRSLQEGLGEFALQLGMGLASHAEELYENYRIKLHLHARRKLHGCLGPAFEYHNASRLHRWLHMSPCKYSLWHNLHQLNTCKAPGAHAKLVTTVHDLNFLYLDSASEIKRKIAKTQRIVSPSDRIVAISEYTKRDIERHLSVDQPIRVIYNGVTDLTAAPQEPVSALVGKNFFFHISRLSTSKNIQALIDLAAYWPDKTFVFAGPDGPDFARVSEQIRARAITNVTLLPSVSDAQKAWLYANCEVFLFPSLAEGFGLPPIEAMYFGKPVIVSRLTSLPEVCGEAAGYCDSFTPADMQQVTLRTLDAAKREGYSKAVRARAQQFDWSRCTSQYVATYLEALGLS